MMMYSVELYGTLECGWVQCGGIPPGVYPEREQEVLRQVAWAKTFGLPLELLGPEEAGRCFPLMVTDGRALRVPTLEPTGTSTPPADPTRSRRGRARAAHRSSRTRGSPASTLPAGGSAGVQTEWGPIEAEIVVNAGGMFAAENRPAGRRPRADHPVRHEYLVTQPFRERPAGDTCRRCAIGPAGLLPARRAPAW